MATQTYDWNADPCRVVGCARPLFVKGDQLCQPHYERLRKYGATDEQIQSDDRKTGAFFNLPVAPICSVESCERTVRVDGMCGKHSTAQRLYGDPLLTADEFYSTYHIKTVQPPDDTERGMTTSLRQSRS